MIGIGIAIPLVKTAAGGPTYTARTQAFLTATGINDATIASALDTMDTALISAGLLPSGTGAGKIKALYPMVGGTATTHKFNFVNPADTDAAFRLSFSGGWTHSANGAKPNGTNAYADTFLNPLTSLSQNNTHVSYYSRTDINASAYQIGCRDGYFLDLAIRYGGTTYGGVFATEISFSDANSLGLYVSSRLLSNEQKLYKNGELKSTGGQASNTPINYKIYLGAYNNAGIASNYSSNECAFATVGEGLTQQQNTDLFNLVNNFQTALSRNV